MKEDILLWVLLFFGGVLGGIAVLLGECGAHGLEDLFITSARDRFFLTTQLTSNFFMPSFWYGGFFYDFWQEPFVIAFSILCIFNYLNFNFFSLGA